MLFSYIKLDFGLSSKKWLIFKGFGCFLCDFCEFLGGENGQKWLKIVGLPKWLPKSKMVKSVWIELICPFLVMGTAFKM